MSRGKINEIKKQDETDEHFETIKGNEKWCNKSFEKSFQNRIKYGTKWSACVGMLMEYSANSTVHGLRYLLEPKHIFERIFWIMAILMSLFGGIALIQSAYTRWKDFPVIVTFQEKTMPVYAIPFPSVLICPETKFDSEVFNFTKVFDEVLEANWTNADISNETLEMMSAALHVCDEENVELLKKYIPDFNSSNIRETLENIMYSKNQTLPVCKWNQDFRFCENIFATVTTEEGICFQFNGLDRDEIFREGYFNPEDDSNEYHFEKILQGRLTLEQKANIDKAEWTLAEGYASWARPNAYPQRSIHGGVKTGFTIVLFSKDYNIDYKCRASVQGYKVRLLSPDDVSVSLEKFIRVPHSQSVALSVTPDYITTSEGLRRYSPERRQCFFNEERYLRFFKTYTQENCEYECLVNFTIAHCGCVKYTMPKPPNIQICTLQDIQCYNNAKEKLFEVEFDRAEMLGDIYSSQCNCLPSCVSLSYNYEISQARYDLGSPIAAWNETIEEGQIGSLLTIEFKENQFFAVKRTELYGLASFVAVCGGIFSLMLGVSMLSFVELLYFLSLRLAFNLRTRFKRKSNGF